VKSPPKLDIENTSGYATVDLAAIFTLIIDDSMKTSPPFQPVDPIGIYVQHWRGSQVQLARVFRDADDLFRVQIVKANSGSVRRSAIEAVRAAEDLRAPGEISESLAAPRRACPRVDAGTEAARCAARNGQADEIQQAPDRCDSRQAAAPGVQACAIAAERRYSETPGKRSRHRGRSNLERLNRPSQPWSWLGPSKKAG
jgi:hypothetical protein